MSDILKSFNVDEALKGVESRHAINSSSDIG